ncbi:MAG: Zn-dependent exopeptidase M28 [Pontiellaceae bacterium]|nr:Zn-dependent exopeptidase M28 [Pontiellaceae bacterium]
MNKKLISRLSALIGLLLSCSAFCGCEEKSDAAKQPKRDKSPSRPIVEFDGERAFKEVVDLIEFSPRDAGTRGASLAADHILSRLTEFGIQAEIDTFEDNTPHGIKTFHNVIGRIHGTDGNWIILGSHFDTMSGIDNFQGANDSGSSTGVLLELARMLKKTQPRTGIIFAFFDGEEAVAGYVQGDGLHGSRHMVQQLLTSGESRFVKSMILMDMIGDRDLNITAPKNGTAELKKVLLHSANTVGLRDYVSLMNTEITDDHKPFLDAGIPAIDLIDFRFGSAPGLNDYWHTEKDRLEHISAESLKITGTIVLEMVRNLAFETDR